MEHNYSVFKVIFPKEKVYVGRAKIQDGCLKKTISEILGTLVSNAKHNKKSGNCAMNRAVRKNGNSIANIRAMTEIEWLGFYDTEKECKDAQRYYIKDLNTVYPNGLNTDKGCR